MDIEAGKVYVLRLATDSGVQVTHPTLSLPPPEQYKFDSFLISPNLIALGCFLLRASVLSFAHSGLSPKLMPNPHNQKQPSPPELLNLRAVRICLLRAALHIDEHGQATAPSMATLRRWASSERLPGVKVGGRWFVSRQVFLTFCAQIAQSAQIDHPSSWFRGIPLRREGAVARWAD